MTTLTKICLSKFLGKCPDCKVDYDSTHYPNNYNCPRYVELKFNTFNVITKGSVVWGGME